MSQAPPSTPPAPRTSPTFMTAPLPAGAMSQTRRMAGSCELPAYSRKPWTVQRRRGRRAHDLSLSGSRYTSFRHGGVTPRRGAVPARRAALERDQPQALAGGGALVEVHAGQRRAVARAPRTRRRGARGSGGRSAPRECGRRGSRATRASSRSRRSSGCGRPPACSPGSGRARWRAPSTRPSGSIADLVALPVVLVEARDRRRCRAPPRPTSGSRRCAPRPRPSPPRRCSSRGSRASTGCRCARRAAARA